MKTLVQQYEESKAILKYSLQNIALYPEPGNNAARCADDELWRKMRDEATLDIEFILQKIKHVWMSETIEQLIAEHRQANPREKESKNV